jgi:4-hydroxyphenylpyruvate dioxygenase
MGTRGFEFIEYAAPDPAAMGKVFEKMGFSAVAKHRAKNVILYRQGEINFIVNAEPDSFGQRFARLHGPSICAIAFRVDNAAVAYARALELGGTHRCLCRCDLARAGRNLSGRSRSGGS